MSLTGSLRALATTGLVACSLAAGLALAPTATAADTSSTVSITDPAGDARNSTGLFAPLSPNTPTLDLLRYAVTRDSASLTTVLTLAALDPGRPDRYTLQLDPQAADPERTAVSLFVTVADGTAVLEVRPDTNDPSILIPVTPTFDTATGTVHARFSRARIDEAIATLGGTPLSTSESLHLAAAATGRAAGLAGGTVTDVAGEFASTGS